MKTLKDFSFNGYTVLCSVLETSEYRGISQAIASLTLFSHPITVAQTDCQNLFQVIRCRSTSERGSYAESGGIQVMLDDNMAAIEAFLSSNGIKRYHTADCQFNHVWPDSRNVNLYTNLANICMSPAFLAKLTDTDQHVRELLRFRAFELYKGFSPNGDEPAEPSGYRDLEWADPLPPVPNLESQLRDEMRKKRSNRTVRSAKEIGWVFSSFAPDTSL